MPLPSALSSVRRIRYAARCGPAALATASREACHSAVSSGSRSGSWSSSLGWMALGSVMSPPSSVEGGSLEGFGGALCLWQDRAEALWWKPVGDSNSLIDDRSKG